MTTALLASCTTPKQLGERPAGTLQDAVETYLERYQPGPQPRLFQTTRITDRHGTLLTEFWEEGRRTWVPLSDIAPALIDATIATEDATFYTNPGIDPARIAGAALQNAQQGGVVSGASTITMQLARNLFFGVDVRTSLTMDRKMLEAGLAQEITTLFSKDELLEMYLNLINYGHLAYGPEAASRVYFNKSARDLTLAEASLLAGIPQLPANLDPLKDLDAARARQRVVLDMMVRHGKLTQPQADAAFAEPLVFNPDPDRRVLLAPHFVHYVTDEAQKLLGNRLLARSGWQITTTLDLPMQTLAQNTVSTQVAEVQADYDLSNAALVALQPGSGQILALVGSADFNNAAIDGQVNVATSLRQPGSAIKPMLYATAFNDALLSPASVIWDVPVSYALADGQVYKPANYDQTFHGPVTARTALANSYNIPAVKLLDAVGIGRMLSSAQAMGLHSLTQDETWYGLSLTLGGGEVTLLDLTSAYATLANNGTYLAPTPFLAISDSAGRAIPAPQVTGQPLTPAAAFQITDILSDNAARQPTFSADSPLRLSRPAAAKTGTTTDWRDNWTLGYSRFLVAGVWAGNSDGHPMRNTSGLTGAAPIWHDFMEGVLADPALLATLQASDDPAAWAFTPPNDMQPSASCPPTVLCRVGGDYFSAAWLAATGERGPLTDSVLVAPAAPVYADRGNGAQFIGYCHLEGAAAHTMLRLPDGVGLAAPPTDAAATRLQREREQAIAWTLRRGLPLELGACDQLASDATLTAALALDTPIGEIAAQVFVDFAAAQSSADAVPMLPSPTAEPIEEVYAPPSALAPVAPGAYTLAEPISHHAACTQNYILGTVLDAAGAPQAGVRIHLADEWGNVADAWSKDGPNDYGHYDFLINSSANRYTLTVLDAAGNPLSAPVLVEHLQGEAGDAPCHNVIWRGG
ncbi:MAG: transglycosylase domain-containing protein [Anaerolineae bacterium]